MSASAENLIKKTDLRIGNWISDVHASSKGAWQVDVLFLNRCRYGAHFISKYKDLRGIPLTRSIRGF